MSLLLGGLAARRAGLGCRGSGRFFLGPASNRLVFGDAALCVFGGVVGRPRPPLGRLLAGRRRCMPRVHDTNGRASLRERVWQYVSISAGDVYFNKKTKTYT